MAPTVEYAIGTFGAAKLNASRNITDADFIVIFNTPTKSWFGACKN